MTALASCSNRRNHKEPYSPTSRLLGYHVNLPNTLTRLAEQGAVSRADLQSVLEANKAWFQGRKRVETQPFMGPGSRPGADANSVRKLVLDQGHGNGLNLRGKDLAWANLTRSTEQYEDLFGFQMDGAVLSGLCQPGFKGAYKREDGQVVWRSFTDLHDANMLGAELRLADLSCADLREALLLGADLTQANLRSTDLYGADLRWAEFVGTDLTNADVGRANLAGVLYEPLAGALPEITSFISARNISSMRWGASPAGLMELREAFKKSGLRDQERAMTFAIRRSGRLRAAREGVFSRFQAVSSLVLFEWTTGYGMYPWRALIVLVGLIPAFAVPYGVALFVTGRSGIWALRMKDAVHSSAKSRAKRVSMKTATTGGVAKRTYALFRAMRIALYFSVLSAFRVGFREANIGEWIERLQSREYVLRATGWVRTMAGFQSLISVYLLAMWSLTLFGRPFD